jgi:hypothetical protein
MDYRNLNILGAVRLEPDFPLADTATKLGAGLGGIRFKKDPIGTSDEFPSFSAQAAGLSFILLGIPEADEQIGDEPITDYTLQIGLAFRSENAKLPCVPCDASAYYSELITAKTDLKVVCST